MLNSKIQSFNLRALEFQHSGFLNLKVLYICHQEIQDKHDKASSLGKSPADSQPLKEVDLGISDEKDPTVDDINPALP